MAFFRNRNKYGARKTTCKYKKHPHPSGLEAAVCDILSVREIAKEILDVKWIASVQLTRLVRWKVDFSFFVAKTGEKVWCEAKGKEMADFILKKKLWMEGFGPGRLEIWKGSYRYPKLTEIITPESNQTHAFDLSSALDTKSDLGTEGDDVTKGKDKWSKD